MESALSMLFKVEVVLFVQFQEKVQCSKSKFPQTFKVKVSWKEALYRKCFLPIPKISYSSVFVVKFNISGS